MAWRPLLALALGAALVACYGPTAPFGAPCGADTDCPSSQTCNLETKTCGPPSESQVWRDDTAEDFAADGAYRDEVTIEPGGFVGPTAYLAGGLRLGGIDSHVIPDRLTPWNEVAAVARTGTGLVRHTLLDLADGPPVGVGLTRGDNITVLVEGELYLDTAGVWRFELHADDIGFLELAPPSSPGSFRRVVTDQDLTSEGTFEVAEPGWHRLRGAFADRSGAMAYELRYDPPGTGGLRSIPWHNLRGPTGDLAGYVVDGFEDPFLIGTRGSVIHAGTLGDRSLGTDPFGLPVGNSSYSLRFAAQVRIDAPGDYAFRLQTSQGHRAWIDGALVADQLDTSPQTSMIAPRSLDAGWHDLAIDLNRSNAESVQIDLAVASGPAWEGQTIPLDHLRPVVGRGTRWAARGSTASLAIPDMGTATRTLSIDMPSDFVATRFDAAIDVTHPDHATLELKADPPNAAPYTIVAAGSLTSSGSLSRHAIVPLSPAGSSWSITATDTAADTATGSITYAGVTMIGTGGPAPFAKTFAYVSAPRELGAVTSIASVRWALRQARPGAGAAVALRTCDDAAACGSEPWTLVAEGAVPAVPPRRFAQYKIEVLSDGDVATALDWIEIGYRTAEGR